MKILYAIQGTGNGHISRALEVGPALEKHGQVDYMISGAQVEVELPRPIKYRSPGLGFYFGKKGGVNLSKTVSKNISPRFVKEVRDFPIEDYDLIVNDFEPVTAWAARLKGKKCIGLSHQGALRSKKCPKPASTDLVGKLILSRYAPATAHYGFHFSAFDDNIFTPIVRQEIRKAEVSDQGHYTVYLPAYSDEALMTILGSLSDIRWEVFSKHTRQAYDRGNISIKPINQEVFNKSITTCTGVLCGAGFETPSEALYLGKKLMVIPMKNQYEQHCNAVALENMGVPVISALKCSKLPAIRKWASEGQPLQMEYPDETEAIVTKLIAEQTSV